MTVMLEASNELNQCITACIHYLLLLHQAVVGGAGDFVIPGTAQCIATELPFAGLSKFGAAFLNHFEASVCRSELLEQLTFIDTPGVLAGGNSKDRGYSFPAVASWFADRYTDAILLLLLLVVDHI
jgi:EH domain-containing protein 1